MDKAFGGRNDQETAENDTGGIRVGTIFLNEKCVFLVGFALLCTCFEGVTI
jgi:hypothetical protein